MPKTSEMRESKFLKQTDVGGGAARRMRPRVRLVRSQVEPLLALLDGAMPLARCGLDMAEHLVDALALIRDDPVAEQLEPSLREVVSRAAEWKAQCQQFRLRLDALESGLALYRAALRVPMKGR